MRQRGRIRAATRIYVGARALPPGVYRPELEKEFVLTKPPVERFVNIAGNYILRFRFR